MPYYQKAEWEIGVSGEVTSQRALGVEFEKDYVYPMHEMPPSYLDQMVAKDFNGMKVRLDEEEYELWLSTFPQGRNGVPNEAYKPLNGGKLFKPVGAVTFHQPEEGERCQGNTNCVPICPVQAKYDARKTLAKALGTGRVDVLTQAVASEVHFDNANGAVKEITVDHPYLLAWGLMRKNGGVGRAPNVTSGICNLPCCEETTSDETQIPCPTSKTG